MAKGKNTELRIVRPGTLVPDVKNFTSSVVTYNQGDFLIFDAVNSLVRAPTAEAECSTFLGVASLDVISGVPRSPYQGLTDVDAAQAIPSMLGPVYGNSFQGVVKTGVNLTPGIALYADIATAGNGVSPSGTKQVGIYQGPSVTTSAAGLVVEVLVGARWPNDSLKF